MRCALAMIVKVNVVAGTDGKTEASTRWTRSHSGSRAQSIRCRARTRPRPDLTVRKAPSEVIALGCPRHDQPRSDGPEVQARSSFPDPAEHLAEHRGSGPIVLRDDEAREGRFPSAGSRRAAPWGMPMRAGSRDRPSGAAVHCDVTGRPSGVAEDGGQCLEVGGVEGVEVHLRYVEAHGRRGSRPC